MDVPKAHLSPVGQPASPEPLRAGTGGSWRFPLQELEQQLMIEKRNFRKTLKFYQKLLQKEKRNKGLVA